MLFDTNMLIYVDRGREDARQVIVKDDAPAISAATYMEYVPYCRNSRELAKFDSMLTGMGFAIHEIDSDISAMAREYVHRFALSHSMEMGDALLAATAVKHAETLCTGNVKHFRQIPELNLRAFKPD